MTHQKNLRFVDLCCGAGGLSDGLQRAGWNCVYAVDHDSDAIEVFHAGGGKSAICAPLGSIHSGDIPKHDVLVAGFPCQPFSSSGDRSGFGHRDGHVFSEILSIVSAVDPPVVLLENVRGLLSNRFGHTMGMVLRSLATLGYCVEWATINATWLGVPQNRPRVFLLATKGCHRPRCGLAKQASDDAVLSPGDTDCRLVGALDVRVSGIEWLSLDNVIKETEPKLGRPRPTRATPFRGAGWVCGACCATFDVRGDPKVPPNRLRVICLGDDPPPVKVRSVRYWGHSGETRPYLKKDPFAHCIGTNIGAGPTFAVERDTEHKEVIETALSRYSNWRRNEDGLTIFRLTPERATRLFGEDVQTLAQAFADAPVSMTKKYVLLGNLVAPTVAEHVGVTVHSACFDDVV